jgi:uncharacterized protein (TIGR00369 family)
MADPVENLCFVCSAANPRGMHLAFEYDYDRLRVVGRFQLGPEYQGGAGIIHGGVVATLLDEVMAKVSRFSGVTAVTAELRVEYLKPVLVGQELHVEGFMTSREGRQLYHEGEIRDAQGVLLARGKARFVIIDREEYHKKANSASGVAKDDAPIEREI